MLHVTTWRWGYKYGDEYVARLESGVRRHLRQEFRWHVLKPQPEDQYLTGVPGCFCRLRMFDPQWQHSMGMKKGDRIVCMDLDSIVTGALDPLFDRAERFCILQNANTMNPCPYNGSLMMLRAGALAEVWSRFSLEAAQKIRFHEFPDDQGWLWHVAAGEAGWRAGAESGVYAFMKKGWPRGDMLARDARLVVFPGWRDPSMFINLGWVQQHWLKAA